MCLVSMVSVFGQLTREPNTTLKLPQAPAQKGYALQQVFGRTFSAPVALATPPGETNRLFIVEQAGRILVITNVTAATPTVLTFLDIRGRVLAGGEQGLLGLAFHPNYANNGFFYVYYTAPGPRFDRLSRFSVSSTNSNAANPNSEQIILNQADEASNHNAGDVHFGPDGYLYLSLGDEGDGGDSFHNSQRIDKDFFSGILRIDVDKRPGNLAPNPHSAVTANYLVPADNPFVGATAFNGVTLPDPSKVHTEFWAVGLRNPWRMAFDPLTGTLWCADVGQGTREEVDIIVKGGNYGWNYREGTIAYTGTPPAGFHPIEPVYDYSHSVGISITGGRVYRGNRLTQLYGAYIFSDYGSGRMWALRTNSLGKGVAQMLLTESGISAYGYDPSNGDILTCDVETGHIRRLVYSATSTGSPLPATLEETGAFSDMASLTPNAGIDPYELNLPFWSDGAIKKRWFSLPSTNSFLGFDPTNTWLTPTGGVWVKHFEMQMTNGEPASARRLETRFIVRTTDGVYGVTYRWTNETNAVLVPEEGMDEELVVNDGGTERRQVWHYPSRAECQACHTAAAGWVLGFNTPQLNREVTHGGFTGNQIEALVNAGYFSNAVSNVETYPRLSRPDDESVSQLQRVRSYLAANCSQCHRPGGPSQGYFDARFSTPVFNANLINGPLVDSKGDPANRTLAPNSIDHSMIFQKMSIRGPGQMPPIASNVPDPAGVALLSSFITGELAIDLNVSMTAGGEVELRFTRPGGRGIIIEATDALDAGSWSAVDDPSLPSPNPPFPATASDHVITVNQQSDGARYYRARLVGP